MKKTMIMMGLAVLALAGCVRSGESMADKEQRQATEKMVTEAHMAVGMPGVANWTEKRFARMLYELRDGEISTYSYVQDFHGKLHFVCASIGYGIPASVQFSNPERFSMARVGDEGAAGVYVKGVIPQPEPNGLFMPEGLSATYVMCARGDSGEVDPIYIEQPVTVSPFPLVAVDSLQPGVVPPGMKDVTANQGPQHPLG